MLQDPKGLYQTLGLDPAASETDIRKAYRRLALKYHPDKNASEDATAEFQKIASAYEVLSDPERRAMYDSTGCVDSEEVDDEEGLLRAAGLFSAFFGGGMAQDLDEEEQALLDEVLRMTGASSFQARGSRMRRKGRGRKKAGGMSIDEVFMAAMSGLPSFEATCPSGHALKKKKADGGYECDACGKDIPSEKRFFDCRKCDFSMCLSCHKKAESRAMEQQDEEDTDAEVFEAFCEANLQPERQGGRLRFRCSLCRIVLDSQHEAAAHIAEDHAAELEAVSNEVRSELKNGYGTSSSAGAGDGYESFLLGAALEGMMGGFGDLPPPPKAGVVDLDDDVDIRQMRTLRLWVETDGVTTRVLLLDICLSGYLPASGADQAMSAAWMWQMYGTVSDINIKHSERDTFVFVTYARLENAQDAIQGLDQSKAFGSGVIKAAPATRRVEGKGEKPRADRSDRSDRWDEARRDDDRRSRFREDPPRAARDAREPAGPRHDGREPAPERRAAYRPAGPDRPDDGRRRRDSRSPRRPQDTRDYGAVRAPRAARDAREPAGPRHDGREPAPERRAAYSPARPDGGRRASRSPRRPQDTKDYGAVRVNISCLPYDMEEAELKDTASTYGKVLALRVFGDAEKPKRGWVEYATRREAEYAVAELDQRWSHPFIPNRIFSLSSLSRLLNPGGFSRSKPGVVAARASLDDGCGP
ncbi:dnajb14 [Symbiodinium pilosum]|uniref:Dnajb14 protein n=1 Tax=Symbiodinium pilosum TaxID=2952 RepID=A0A812T1D7_SYMPI|nr:dnajb14 [Symbiodinium pilosum]